MALVNIAVPFIRGLEACSYFLDNKAVVAVIGEHTVDKCYSLFVESKSQLRVARGELAVVAADIEHFSERVFARSRSIGNIVYRRGIYLSDSRAEFADSLALKPLGKNGVGDRSAGDIPLEPAAVIVGADRKRNIVGYRSR